METTEVVTTQEVKKETKKKELKYVEARFPIEYSGRIIGPWEEHLCTLLNSDVFDHLEINAYSFRSDMRNDKELRGVMPVGVIKGFDKETGELIVDLYEKYAETVLDLPNVIAYIIASKTDKGIRIHRFMIETFSNKKKK